MRLIDAAEELFGEHGVDGVSLAQIVQKGGHANKGAVQYHFGSKENLVAAIFETRRQRLGERRAEMIEAMRETGSASVRNLLVALIYPIHEMVNAQGVHSYARFVMRVLDSRAATESWSRSPEPGALTVRNMLKALTPHLSAADFELRFLLAIEFLMGALAFIDRNVVKRSSGTKALIDARAKSEQILSVAVDSAARVFEVKRTDEALLDRLSKKRSSSQGRAHFLGVAELELLGMSTGRGRRARPADRGRRALHPVRD
jgi:AcrR family transcriptional regulator